MTGADMDSVDVAWREELFGSRRRRALIGRVRGVSEDLPTILVIQEVWGVDAYIEGVVRRLALSGYLAVAPDLYWLDGARPPALEASRLLLARKFTSEMTGEVTDPSARQEALTGRPDAERERLAETLTVLFPPRRQTDDAVEQLSSWTQLLRGEQTYGSSGHVGVVGFCLGGRLAGLLAGSGTDLAAAVIFYGHAPGEEIARRITCPVLGIYAADDTRVTEGIKPLIEASRSTPGFDYQVHTYQAAHGFFNENLPSYNPGASREAWAATLSFLAARLAASREVPTGPAAPRAK